MNTPGSLLNKIKVLNKQENVNVQISLIEMAIDYIKEYHEGQKRNSGEPYYIHPIEVAYIVSEYCFDTETIIASLLHDIVEDTDSSLIQIELIFGKRIAEIVDAVTKITMDYKLSPEEVLYKLNMSSIQDINKKALLIKLVDRLHNIRTIQHIKSIDKRKRIAQETIEIYVPLAKRINLIKIEQELFDTSNKILNSSS